MTQDSTYALCNSCGLAAPAERVRRDGRVFLTKHCPGCGDTETLVSSNAERYDAKRRLGEPPRDAGCALDCMHCGRHAAPKLVVVEVTNRCNLNCPICISNTPSMGFTFEPPLEYFGRIFRHYSSQSPAPAVQLFGGEPTVRDDLLDIIRLARSYGLYTRVVTNGLRLADEGYCLDLIRSGAEILLAYDGSDPRVYQVLRGSEEALRLKTRALENVARIAGAKVVLMSMVAKEFNDDQVAKLLQFCHERRHCIRAIFFLPLAHTWDPHRFDIQADRITTEDLEAAVESVFAGDAVEFLPAGLLSRLPNLLGRFHIKPIDFLGAHPNCESFYVLFSDGHQFVPMGHYLTGSLSELAQALLDVESRHARRATAWEDSAWGRLLARVRLRDRVLTAVVTVALAATLVRRVKLGRTLRGTGVVKLAHAVGLLLSLAFGRKTRRTLARHTTVGKPLAVVVMPFADNKNLDSDRLRLCPTASAFWDPADDEVKSVPMCAWNRYKADIMRQIALHYEADVACKPHV